MTLRRTVWLLIAAALIASAVLGVIVWSRQWNNPAREQQLIFDGTTSYRGDPVTLLITCECPAYLIESRRQDLPFVFKLQRPKQPDMVRPPLTPNSQSLPASAAPGAAAETIYGWIDSANATIALPANEPSWTVGPEQQLFAGIDASVSASIVPATSGRPQVVFHFQAGVPGQPQLDPNAAETDVSWYPAVRPAFLAAIAPFIYSFLVFAFAFGVFFLIDRRLRQLRQRTERQLDEARNRGDDTHFAWESARIKLEAYFDRNLIQVNLVFWVAVFVMAVGFAFVLAGVFLSLSPANISTAKLTAISGIITQFLGATFMVIYRSTMGQANEFMSVLERINTVGMAVHELERMSDQQGELKNQVRGHLVELLVKAGYSTHTRTEGAETASKKEKS